MIACGAVLKGATTAGEIYVQYARADTTSMVISATRAGIIVNPPETEVLAVILSPEDVSMAVSRTGMAYNVMSSARYQSARPVTWTSLMIASPASTVMMDLHQTWRPNFVDIAILIVLEVATAVPEVVLMVVLQGTGVTDVIRVALMLGL